MDQGLTGSGLPQDNEDACAMARDMIETCQSVGGHCEYNWANRDNQKASKRMGYDNIFKIAQARKATGMTTVEFGYDIGAPVRIKAIDMNGKVDSLSLDNNGKMYRVVYWSNCTRNQVWMYEWELESCK